MTARARTNARGIEIAVPGAPTLHLGRVVFDFNGTLALDGALLPGVASRLRALARMVPVTVLTADTFGTAKQALGGLPVTVHAIRTGHEKAAFVSRWRSAGAAAIGNGTNDAPMLRRATLAIVILGPEGLSTAALRSATVVVSSAAAALDLLLRATRASATLRR